MIPQLIVRLKKTQWLLLAGVLLVVGAFPGIAAPSRTLTVYTYSSFPLPLITAIQQEFQTVHHVNVQFKSFSDSGPLFNQLLREKTKPQADLVIGLDSIYFTRIAKENLFDSYRPQAFQKITPELIFDSKFRMVPFDYGYIVFNYDQSKLDRVPTKFSDLLDPYYKGKIVIENPLTSSPGQVFLLTTIALFGEDGYLDYWKRLRPNLLAITPGWDEAYGMYTSGEVPIVLSYGASPVYHLLYDHTERYKALVLDDAAYAQIEAMGIIRGSRNRQAARMLIDYILSPEFQKLIPENQYMYPVRTDLALPASFRVAAKVKRILNLPQEKVAASLDKWLNELEKAIQ